MMKEIPVESLQLNPMMQIGHEWMLLTAGSAENSYNTMTVAWGHLGVIWNRPGNKRPCHYLPTVAAYVCLGAAGGAAGTAACTCQSQ